MRVALGSSELGEPWSSAQAGTVHVPTSHTKARGHQESSQNNIVLVGRVTNPRLKATLPTVTDVQTLTWHAKGQEHMTCNQEENQAVEREKTEVIGISRQGCSNSYCKYKVEENMNLMTHEWKIYF